MHVAARYQESNGIGGLNATCYQYQDAIFNNQGRGFLGFRSISVEQALVEDPHNNLRTTTLFHQKFPLVNRVHEVHVKLASDDGRLPYMTAQHPRYPLVSSGGHGGLGDLFDDRRVA